MSSRACRGIPRTTAVINEILRLAQNDYNYLLKYLYNLDGIRIISIAHIINLSSNSLFGKFFDRREAPAVDFAGTVFSEHCEMLSCSVALMPVKTVIGIFFMHFSHKPVSRHFGDYGRGGN